MQYAATGLQPIGNVEWGTHFCHFYRTREDLAETLVPFFKTGLENGEAAIWVTADPLDREQARAALNTHVTDLDSRISRGQIAIYGHLEWYERFGSSRSDVAEMWLGATADALSNGYSGMRITGNTAFLERECWDDFMDYELCLREAFREQRIIALCSYNTARCDCDAVLDVVEAHEFALARRRGRWEMVESAAAQRSKAALASLNRELESRVDERTHALSEALAHQRLLTAELSHRVKNTIASVQAIADQTLRTSASIQAARQALSGRLQALAKVHDQLAAVDWRGVELRALLKAVMTPYGERVSLELEPEILAPRAAMDLALVFNELATNAAKYGALSTEDGRVMVQVRREAGPVPALVLDWREGGGPSVARPAEPGFGTKLIERIVRHDLLGDCELRFDRAGFGCTIRVPLREALARTADCLHGARH